MVDDARINHVTTMSRLVRLGRGAAIGIATAVAALGAAELVAGLDRRFASPITQVGNRVIDFAPPWLKTFAIETFGTKDKPVLVGSVYVLLAGFAVCLGVLSRRHRTWAMVGAAMFGLVGAAAALAGVGGFAAAVPSIAGGVVGALVIGPLARRAWTDSQRAEDASPPSAESPIVHWASGPAPGASRRAFLAAVGLVTLVGVGAAASGRRLRSRFDAAVERAKVSLPKAKRPLEPLDLAKYEAGVDGATPFITPNREFYRVDTALEVPQVDLESWTLGITGLVYRELTFSYADLLARDLVEYDLTLTCVSNEVGGRLAGTARWLGVPLRELLAEAGIQESADQVVGRSVDGYTCGFPVDVLDDDRSALVAVGMNGEVLPVEHGFPARLLVAGLYGYVSATKWLTELEITRFDRFDQYWVPRGWDAKAPIKTFSRIDTPAGLGRLDRGTHPIAGVAWAQTRGISKVEVRVDGGPWTEAELKPVPNDETWCQWVLPWDFEQGSHDITCRATDGSGEVQTEQRASPRPNGASGWDSVVAFVS